MPSLDDVKVGDEVIFDSQHVWGVPTHIERVTKVTSTQITTDKDRYNKRTGHRIGSGPGLQRSRIKAATKEEIEQLRYQIRRLNITRYLKDFKWNVLTDEELAVVMELLANRANK